MKCREERFLFQLVTAIKEYIPDFRFAVRGGTRAFPAVADVLSSLSYGPPGGKHFARATGRQAVSGISGRGKACLSRGGCVY